MRQCRFTRAEPVELLAARLGAVAIEVDADRTTPAEARGTAMAVRPELGRLYGRGRHGRSSNTLASPSAGRTGQLPYVVQGQRVMNSAETLVPQEPDIDQLRRWAEQAGLCIPAQGRTSNEVACGRS
jgi:hypothetical protein